MAGRKPTISDDEILEVFTQASDPVLTTSEVSEHIGLSRRGTLDRLSDLSEVGELQMKRVGNAGAVWWSPKSLRARYNEESAN